MSEFMSRSKYDTESNKEGLKKILRETSKLLNGEEEHRFTFPTTEG